ncbi:MAG: two-component regulator propeller domain-containing protein, partial [Bacteroidales bacterium]|nr:two-component regulator propeller domain-containing protein [Bacteroidales bacterium]
MRTSHLALLTVLSAWLFTACSSLEPEQGELPVGSDVHIDNGLSNQRISSIAEDADGFIWIGTQRGLNRYDGDEMHQYFCNDQPNSIPDNRINAVFCDSKGRVWVTSKNGVARYTDRDDFEYILAEGSDINSLQMVETSRGDLYVKQNTEILKYNPERNCFESVISEVSFIDSFLQDFYVDEEDNLWVVDDRHVSCYNTVNFKLRCKFSLGEGVNPQASELIGRKLWLSTISGLRIYDVIAQQWDSLPEAIHSHT